MQKRFLTLTGGMLVVLSQAAPGFATDRIQAVVSPVGRVVFTNQGENTEPTAPAGTSDTPKPTAGIPEPLHSLVHVISRNHGVDPALVAAVMRTESGFNRFAVSPKGARGLMQLIPATGQRFGVRDFFDPQQNIEGGVQYLKFLLNKFEGNLDLSLAAYNAGENLVQRLGRIPAIPETMNYVRKVRAIYNKPSPEPAKPAEAEAATAKADAPRIFRTVDGRGVVHFSTVEPLN